MRIWWSLPLPGPFRVGGTAWRSNSRPGYHGVHSELPGWKCPHNHSRLDRAVACANREAGRQAWINQAPVWTQSKPRRVLAAIVAVLTVGIVAAILIANTAGIAAIAVVIVATWI